MEVTLLQRIYGVEDGKIYPRWFEVGEVVSGELAYSAIEQGAAVSKKKRQPIEPDHRKISSASQPAPVLHEPTVKKRRGRPRKSSS